MTHRRIFFVTYERAELLDLTGPASVFGAATGVDPRIGYDVHALSVSGGVIEHSCGLKLSTAKTGDFEYSKNDTILAIGGEAQATAAASNDTALVQAFQDAAANCGRIGSICTGAFLLAASELVGTRSVTTHWAALGSLRARFPNLKVVDNELYVADGRIWTSAGVTAGIDMALAILEQDHGSILKAKVAKRLVVYAHRPGSQSQFSEVLNAQIRSDERFSGLFEWLQSRLDRPTPVDDMAKFVGMSPRSFHRHFSNRFSISPGRFLDDLRLDHARSLLEAGEAVKLVVPKVGFRSPSAFRSAFTNRFGVTPAHYATMNPSNVG